MISNQRSLLRRVETAALVALYDDGVDHGNRSLAKPPVPLLKLAHACEETHMMDRLFGALRVVVEKQLPGANLQHAAQFDERLGVRHRAARLIAECCRRRRSG